jgi:hypothetical protein
LIARPGNCFTAMRHLLTENHDDRKTQRRHIHEAIAIYRSLLDGGIVETLPEPDSQGRTARLTVDLQADFALNQPLSTFALAALELLDKESPSYALDVLTVVESTLDDPRQILGAQLNKARGDAVQEMKMDGIEYDERMERLEEIDYPKPLEELLDHAYEVYRRGHPWVGDHPLRPKTVARDMFERAMTFVEYVGYYELARSEGLVLRYLASAYKALNQTVPDDAKTEELRDLIEWLGELVRQVDSSLLDEWEQLTNPEEEAPEGVEPAEERVRPVTANARAFKVLVRNEMFRRVELASRRRYGDLGKLSQDGEWTGEEWAEAVEAYFAEHDEIGTGPNARGPQMLLIEEEEGLWRVRQILADPAGDHDWGISAEVDLAASDAEGRAVVHVVDVNRL